MRSLVEYTSESLSYPRVQIFWYHNIKFRSCAWKSSNLLARFKATRYSSFASFIWVSSTASLASCWISWEANRHARCQKLTWASSESAIGKPSMRAPIDFAFSISSSTRAFLLANRSSSVNYTHDGKECQNPLSNSSLGTDWGSDLVIGMSGFTWTILEALERYLILFDMMLKSFSYDSSLEPVSYRGCVYLS